MKVNVSDGNWHSVVIERKKRLGSIQVDGEKPVRITADPGATILNSNGKLWIGMQQNYFILDGHKESLPWFNISYAGGSSILPPGLPSPYYEAFVGCMDQAKVDRHHLDWHRHGDNAILHYCDDTWSGVERELGGQTSGSHIYIHIKLWTGWRINTNSESRKTCYITRWFPFARTMYSVQNCNSSVWMTVVSLTSQCVYLMNSFSVFHFVFLFLFFSFYVSCNSQMCFNYDIQI